MKRLAVLGHPGRALALAGDADRRARGARARRRVVLRGDRHRRPRSSRSGRGRCPDEGFVGANVTIPHKEAALALADDASTAATEIGAANTLSFDGGEIRADNTDAPGLLAALAAPPAGMRALGARRRRLGPRRRLGARPRGSDGRGLEPDRRARRRARPRPRRRPRRAPGTTCRGSPRSRPSRRWAGGLRADRQLHRGRDGGRRGPLRGAPARRRSASTAAPSLVDLVYGGGETELVREARERGAEVVDGLEVLVRQGAESLRIWTGAGAAARRDARGSAR